MMLEPATLCVINPSVASKQAIKQAIIELITSQWPVLTQTKLITISAQTLPSIQARKVPSSYLGEKIFLF